MLATDANPGGLPRSAFDPLRTGVATDRAAFYRELAIPFYGTNRPGVQVSQGILDTFWAHCMTAGLKASYDCIAQFSETDFTADLARFDVPTLIIHGDDDQIVPIGAAAMLSAKLIPGAELKIYPGAPHGLAVTERERFNADLIAFLRS
jgi:non-heme chloroperoxidase